MTQLKEILLHTHNNNDWIYCVDLAIILNCEPSKIHATLRSNGLSAGLQREKVDGMKGYVIPHNVAIAIACKLNINVGLEIADIY